MVPKQIPQLKMVPKQIPQLKMVLKQIPQLKMVPKQMSHLTTLMVVFFIPFDTMKSQQF